MQVLAVANKHAWRDAPRHMCCKQRWTLSVINLQPKTKLSWQRLRWSTLSKVANF